MKPIYLLFSFELFFIISCSKETNCVNQLSGTWSISTMTLIDSTGGEIDLLYNDSTTSSGFVEFSRYNTATTDDRGILRQTMNVFNFSSQNLSQVITETSYRIDENCSMILTYDSNSNNPLEYASIMELTQSSAILKIEDPHLGIITTGLSK